MIEKIKNYYRSNKGIVKQKFVHDTIFSFGAGAASSVFGFACNFAVVKLYEHEGLAGFNLSLYIMMLFLFPSLFGLNSSIIRYASAGHSSKSKASIFSAGLYLVLLFSCTVALVGIILIPAISAFYNKLEIASLLNALFWTIPIYSVNRYFLGYLNGIREMKFYYAIVALRPIFVFVSIIGFYFYGLDINALGWTVMFAELMILLPLLLKLRIHTLLTIGIDKYWLKEHLHFGFSNFLVDLFADLSFKIDVFMASYFLNPRLLGIYIFSSDLVKGLTIFPIQIQLNFNPIISQAWHRKALGDLIEPIHNVKRYTYLVFVPLALLATMGYMIIQIYFVNEKITYENMLPFLILLIGYVYFSGYQALLGLLTYTGLVKFQVIRIVGTVLLCAILSIALIPLLGVYGVAIAVCFTTILTVLWFKMICRKYLNLKI